MPFACWNDIRSGSARLMTTSKARPPSRSRVSTALCALRAKLCATSECYFSARAKPASESQTFSSRALDRSRVAAERSPRALLVCRFQGARRAEPKRSFHPQASSLRRITQPLTDTVAIIESVRPSVLIGVSGKPGVFSRAVLEAVARQVARPIVFALSNPTSLVECTAEEAYRWTEGRAIFASGSPFDPVSLFGRRFVPGQGNNAYIFPGVGLGVIACASRLVTDEMFLAAARALAHQVSQAEFDEGRVYPRLTHIREVSRAVAVAVIRVAFAKRIGRCGRAGRSRRIRPIADV